jgi:hypothetical protein
MIWKYRDKGKVGRICEFPTHSELPDKKYIIDWDYRTGWTCYFFLGTIGICIGSYETVHSAQSACKKHLKDMIKEMIDVLSSSH